MTEADAAESATDPIPNMTIQDKLDLCQNVSKARLFLTEEDYDSPLKNVDYRCSYPREPKLDYGKVTAFAADEPILINLLACSENQHVYVTYGFDDNHYFVFIKAEDEAEIRLFSIAEPSPIRNNNSIRNKEQLYNVFWQNAMNLSKF